jgi:hypothetical protein
LGLRLLWGWAARDLEEILRESEGMGVVERVAGGWRIADPDLAWWLDRLPPLPRCETAPELVEVAA